MRYRRPKLPVENVSS